MLLPPAFRQNTRSHRTYECNQHHVLKFFACVFLLRVYPR